MQNHKKFLRHWQQPITQFASSSAFSKQAKCEASLLPEKTLRDHDNLRRKLFEMKHRVCLLEFGLGSVANLMQDLNSPHGDSGGGGIGGIVGPHSSFTTKEADNAKYKQVLKGIGQVLQDVESCMKTSTPPSRTESNIPTVQSEIGETSQVCKRKAQIYIDETKPDNETSRHMTTSTDVCNIQVLENPAIIPSGSNFYQKYQQQCSNVNESLSYHDKYYLAAVTTPADPKTSSSPFDALSTLASVATSKHSEELMKGASTQELVIESFGQQENMGKYSSGAAVIGLTEKTRGHQLVNPFIFSEEEEESNNMPLKKRRRPPTINFNIVGSLAESTNGGINCGDGKSTRRSARRCYQK